MYVQSYNTNRKLLSAHQITICFINDSELLFSFSLFNILRISEVRGVSIFYMTKKMCNYRLMRGDLKLTINGMSKEPYYRIQPTRRV